MALDASATVSVIIPVYNSEKYLAAAIASALEQTLPPIEIIVVDDGSTDASAAIARGFGTLVWVESQPHRGTAAARNRGVALARGEFIAFLDADDVWSADKLSDQIAQLGKQPDAEMVFGQVEQFVSPDVQMRVQVPDHPVPGLCASALLIRRVDFYRAGEFGQEWKLGEFIEWYARAVELGLRVAVLPQVVSRRRIHRTNQTVFEPGLKMEYLRVLKATLDRRRKIKR